MLRMKSLTEDLRKADGFIMDAFVLRSMFETTSTQEAPDNRKQLTPFKYLKLTMPINSIPSGEML